MEENTYCKTNEHISVSWLIKNNIILETGFICPTNQSNAVRWTLHAL